MVSFDSNDMVATLDRGRMRRSLTDRLLASAVPGEDFELLAGDGQGGGIHAAQEC